MQQESTQLSDELVRALVTTNVQGFPYRARNLFVATFILLLYYLILLLLKYLTNQVRPYSSRSAYEEYGGMPYKKSMKQPGYLGKLFGHTASVSAVPPPPPPPTGGFAAAKSGGLDETGMGTPAGMGQGMGPMNTGGPMPGPGGPMSTAYDPYNSHGVESERGYYLSVRYSRAADVARIGYWTLLGGTVISALTFNIKSAAVALGWVYFSLVTLWIILAFLSPRRWIPLVMGFLSFPILIAMWSVAFQVNRSQLGVFEGI